MFKIFLDSSFILSVKIVSFPSILISKYILIAIGKPTFEKESSCYPFLMFKIFLDSSFILSVKIVSFPSILISKYILIAIGKPTFAIRGNLKI